MRTKREPIRPQTSSLESESSRIHTIYGQSLRASLNKEDVKRNKDYKLQTFTNLFLEALQHEYLDLGHVFYVSIGFLLLCCSRLLLIQENLTQDGSIREDSKSKTRKNYGQVGLKESFLIEHLKA